MATNGLARRRNPDDVGCHVAFIYESDEDRHKILASFIRQGVEAREKVLYICDFVTSFEGAGFRMETSDPERDPAKGSLEIRSAEEFCFKEGVLEPDAIIDFLDHETRRARGEGYSGMRVSSEMCWALSGRKGCERFIEFESKLDKYLKYVSTAFLCQYDKRRFSPALLLYVLAAHPLLVHGSSVYVNSYYHVFPVFMSRTAAGETLSDWLQDLATSRLQA